MADFRKISSHTVQDNYPIASGFYKILVFPDHKERTVFSIHKGHWQFKQMPVGLKNTPASFQRVMNIKL